MENKPYDGVGPNSTCDVEAWSVLQVITAEVPVMADIDTPVIEGGATGIVVVSVKLADVATVPPEFAESTAKS